jgi:hypothetical protein
VKGRRSWAVWRRQEGALCGRCQSGRPPPDTEREQTPSQVQLCHRAGILEYRHGHRVVSIPIASSLLLSDSSVFSVSSLVHSGGKGEPAAAHMHFVPTPRGFAPTAYHPRYSHCLFRP